MSSKINIISFNVNGIRARQHSLEQLIKEREPDIIGLQETKVDDQLFPLEPWQELGFHVERFGQKSFNGVALLSRYPMRKPMFGFYQGADEQKRLLGVEVDTPWGELYIYNGYFPQGESRSHPSKFPNKQRFYSDLLKHLQQNHSPEQRLLVMGDFNVAFEDIDIGIGDNNRNRWLRDGKCCFLPEEREWYGQLLDWGLADTFRINNPEAQLYSWYDYRSGGFDKEPPRGLRIDYQLVTKPLQPHCLSAQILTDYRGLERPSDHCPIELTLGNK